MAVSDADCVFICAATLAHEFMECYVKKKKKVSSAHTEMREREFQTWTPGGEGRAADGQGPAGAMAAALALTSSAPLTD